jgi:hypothetical protein
MKSPFYNRNLVQTVYLHQSRFDQASVVQGGNYARMRRASAAITGDGSRSPEACNMRR